MPLALALSGGGFRATLAALGVRFLADAKLLHRVRYVSSVSVARSRTACSRATILRSPTADSSRRSSTALVPVPFVERISRNSLVWKRILNLTPPT